PGSFSRPASPARVDPRPRSSSSGRKRYLAPALRGRDYRGGPVRRHPGRLFPIRLAETPGSILPLHALWILALPDRGLGSLPQEEAIFVARRARASALPSGPKLRFRSLLGSVVPSLASP